MKPTSFIQAYEKALASQDWQLVEPLISDNACVTFSNGKVNRGIDEIKEAFEYNFSVIKNEKFTISNVNWVRVEDSIAVYTFNFSWKGIINGKDVEGSGVGTSSLVFEGDSWKLLTEHLTSV